MNREPRRKKLIVENIDHPENDIKTSNKSNGEEKRAKEIIIERPKCHSCDEKFTKFIEEATKRIDNLEKSKQAEEEILNNSTQIIQEAPDKMKKKVENAENEKTQEKMEMKTKLKNLVKTQTLKMKTKQKSYKMNANN